MDHVDRNIFPANGDCLLWHDGNLNEILDIESQRLPN
jgi:hypothetical protein